MNRILQIKISILVFFTLTLFQGLMLSGQTGVFSIDSMLRLPDTTVLVAAHRGDWRNHPENSLSAIQSCIDRGIDIVEIDVRKTKDGHFVLMHDATIQRTTNGRGRVKDMSLQTLQNYFLKGPDGKTGNERIPSLEEAISLARGKIILNLDKSAIAMEELIGLTDSLGAQQCVILKGSFKAGYFKEKNSRYAAGPLFMPILKDQTAGALDTFLMNSGARVVELILDHDRSDLCKPEGIEVFKRNQCRIWYNALYKSIACGYGENRNALMTWDFMLDRNAFIIQTDYPFELMQYLINKGIRQAPQGWREVSLTGLPSLIIDTAAMHNAAHEQGTARAGEGVYHTIKSGDTLYGLALHYKTTIKAICALNANLTEKTVLQIGRKIRVR